MQVIEQKMATEWKEEFHIKVEFPTFLGEVVDRTIDACTDTNHARYFIGQGYNLR